MNKASVKYWISVFEPFFLSSIYMMVFFIFMIGIQFTSELFLQNLPAVPLVFMPLACFTLFCSSTGISQTYLPLSISHGASRAASFRGQICAQFIYILQSIVLSILGLTLMSGVKSQEFLPLCKFYLLITCVTLFLANLFSGLTLLVTGRMQFLMTFLGIAFGLVIGGCVAFVVITFLKNSDLSILTTLLQLFAHISWLWLLPGLIAVTAAMFFHNHMLKSYSVKL